MASTRRTTLTPLALVAALAVAACGGSSGDGAASLPAPTETDAAAPTSAAPADEPDSEPEASVVEEPEPAEEPSGDDGEITSVDGVQSAAIQILAKGSFRDPAAGYASGGGSGSGFIISSDGLAVTNNHVVTGAATLEVFIGGDTTKSYNATVVGVSECNDLAVIDIIESEPLPTLDWYDGELNPGLDVYAAGFPLGDPEYTLTKGIVTKERGNGDITGRSSIDHTLEHDANLQPGNSGGALVTEDGKVVGVNYAKGPDVTNTAQFYAIASPLAIPVVERLRDGDFESIGVNGWAVVDEGLGISGIWVAGVAPGSPAANVGLLAGDIITLMNGLPVGTDLTVKDYCDVLRTAGDRPIDLQVLRFDTGEVLRGELNGERALELSFSLAESVEETVEEADVAPPEQAPAETPDAPPPAAGYATFVPIRDDTGRLSLEVPAEWAALSTAPVTLDDGTTLPVLIASPDLDLFNTSYDVPGVLMTALDGVTDVDAALAQFSPSADECSEIGREDYADAKFTGRYVVFGSCGTTGAVSVLLAAVPIDGTPTITILGAQMLTEADIAALDTFFSTFDTV